MPLMTRIANLPTERQLAYGGIKRRMDEPTWTQLGQLLLSLALGILVGIERGWRSRSEANGTRVAGVRTFGLLGLVGGLAATIHHLVHVLPAAIILGGCVTGLLAGYWRGMKADGNASATGLVAGVMTLGVGFLAASGQMVLAAAVGAISTALLASRAQLHGLIAGMSARDVQATARFAIITAVVLPLLPNRFYGPYDAWNPRDLWLVVVLVTGFSFAGYIANKRFGAKNGTLVTAAIGGMYSSTAVTAVLSQRLKEDDKHHRVLGAGIALASALMYVRVMALTAMLAPEALPALSLLIGPAALVAAGASLWLMMRSDRTGTTPPPSLESTNPFELLPAFGFAALVAATALATRWAESRFGEMGSAVLIAITGSFDVDAAIVTLGGLPDGSLGARVAGIVLAVPVLVNMLFKAAIVVVTAGGRRGWRAASPLLMSAGAAALSLAVMLVAAELRHG